MKKILAFLALSAALISPSHAGVIYTTSAAFLSQVGAGAYTEHFDGLNSVPPSSFTNGTFSYTITSDAAGLYSSGDFLGTDTANRTLTINFTGSAVTALGANFYTTDRTDQFRAISLTLNLSDGTVETFTPESLVNSYRGFISDVGISSLVIQNAPGIPVYVGLDNLTIGAVAVQVPEPASWAMVCLGLAGLLMARRRAA